MLVQYIIDQVIRLDISMDYPMRSEMVQSLKQLLHYQPDLFLCEVVLVQHQLLDRGVW